MPAIAGGASWHLPTHALELARDEAHLWRARCEPAEIAPALFASQLTTAELARAVRLATPTLRRRYLQAHALLHTLLAAYLPENSPRRELGYHAEGKPYLAAPQLFPALEFNMSHAGELVLIVLARGRAVGVDVEHVRPLDDLEAMIGAICSVREQVYLAKLVDDARLSAFYRLWTRKEAWLKQRGVGIAGGLAAADVLDALEGVRLCDVALDDMAGVEPHAYVGTVALPDASAANVTVFDATWRSR